LAKGSDPELQKQIITEVAFMSMEEIKSLPDDSVHGLFRKCDSLSDVFGLNGYVIS
jgi:8-oxo-dGTP diphosphatase